MGARLTLLLSLMAVPVFAPAALSAQTIGPPLVYSDERDGALTRSEIFELQLRLAVLGYSAGEPDGVLGAKTRAMVDRLASALGVTFRDIRHALATARQETAVRTLPPPIPASIPPCKPGSFTSAALYTHLQAWRIWGNPISRSAIEGDRENADWAEVVCRSESQVDRVEFYERGSLARTAHYTYRTGGRAPLQIQYRDPQGEISQTIHIGRLGDGSLTHIVSLGESGQPGRLIAAMEIDQRKLAFWLTLDMEGRVQSRSQIRYDEVSGNINGLTLFRGADHAHKYVYSYPTEGVLSVGFDRYLDNERIHIAKQKRDVFGRVEEERIRLTSSAGGTYNNRYYKHGNLVREERDDEHGNVIEYRRSHDKSGLSGSRLIVNGRHVGDIEVIRDGVETKESRFVLSDGRIYARYPGHVVWHVDRNGKPGNGGAFERLVSTSLW